MYVIGVGGVTIGHTALENPDPRNRSASGQLIPTPDFERWGDLLAGYWEAKRAAEATAQSLEEKRRNLELAEETLGFCVLDGAGHVLGRAATLSDGDEPDTSVVTVVFKEPNRDELRERQR
jgi:hypothetical protein